MVTGTHHTVHKELTAQREYAEQLGLQGDGFALVAVRSVCTGH